MLPQKLTLEGVYSYKAKQTIEFRPLTGGGIFGIFGPVGSGKSAILEAMTYALYGQIERLSQADQRGYNMMNLQSERMFIDFEFTHSSTRYRFTVSAKRQKKNFETISTPERQGYIYSEDQWVPLEDQKIRGGVTAESILGLSYEHFRRTIIIPQGKFQEFIQLTPTHRTGMMETLFNLERFNLYGKSAALLTAVRTEKAFQEGRMEELEKFRKEELDQLKKLQKESEDNLSAITDELKIRNSQLRTMEETGALLEEEKTSLVRQKGIRARIPEYEKRQEHLEQYKRVHSVFHPLIRREQSLKEEQQQKDQEFSRIDSRMKEAQRLLREGEEKWTVLKKEWEKKETLLSLLRSYTASAEIRRLEKAMVTLEKEQVGLNTIIRQHRKEEERISREKEDLLQSIQEMEQSLPDWDEIQKIENWFNSREIAERDSASLEKQMRELQEEQTELLRELLSKIPSREESAEETEERFRRILREGQDRQEEDRQHLREEQVFLQTEKNLLDLSGNLTEGAPCPVCGSLHHPAPLSHGEFAEKEKTLADKEADLKEKDRALAEMLKTGNSYSAGSERIRVQLSRIESQRDRIEAEKKQALKDFTWPSFAPDRKEDFSRYLKESRDNQKNLREHYQTLRRIDQTLKERQSAAEMSLKREQQITLENSQFTASKRTWEEQLIEDHRSNLPPEPEEKKQQLQEHLNNLEEEYPLMRKQREELETSRIHLEKEQAAQYAVLKELEQRTKEWEESFQEALQETGFETPGQVQKIISQELDVSQEKGEIDRFHQEKNILENHLKDLAAKLVGKEYDPESHSKLKGQIPELEKKRGEAQSGLGGLQKQIADLTTGLQEKEKQKKTLRETQIREENLKELTSLFKKNRFTEYIAEIYLQELCVRANERFFPLSGRTLELVFENNAILVRDYLNDGKTRLVKTLSGGQTFQAALSLALALADQIGMGDDHFFFLDEGFGTLDKESLEMVITTLRRISRDGRIIGLISHVEDLRQDLDVWLQIDRTPDEGSRISSSWNSKGVRE